MDEKEKIIQMQAELLRNMTAQNLKRMSQDFWGRDTVSLDSLQEELEQHTAQQEPQPKSEEDKDQLPAETDAAAEPAES